MAIQHQQQSHKNCPVNHNIDPVLRRENVRRGELTCLRRQCRMHAGVAISGCIMRMRVINLTVICNKRNESISQRDQCRHWPCSYECNLATEVV